MDIETLQDELIEVTSEDYVYSKSILHNNLFHYYTTMYKTTYVLRFNTFKCISSKIKNDEYYDSIGKMVNAMMDKIDVGSIILVHPYRTDQRTPHIGRLKYDFGQHDYLNNTMAVVEYNGKIYFDYDTVIRLIYDFPEDHPLVRSKNEPLMDCLYSFFVVEKHGCQMIRFISFATFIDIINKTNTEKTKLLKEYIASLFLNHITATRIVCSKTLVTSMFTRIFNMPIYFDD